MMIAEYDEISEEDSCKSNIAMLPIANDSIKLDIITRDDILLANNGAVNPPYVPLNVVDPDNPWIRPRGENSLSEVNGTIIVPSGDGVPKWKTCLAYVGPGALIAVGYM